MKKLSISTIILLMFFLNGCDVWRVQPQPFPALTALASQTPSIVTATPIILTLPFTLTPLAGIPASFTSTLTEVPSPTITPTQIDPSITPSTPSPTPVRSLALDILGCNTSIDITHGMGEVTNAYVIVKNTGTVDLANTCAILSAVDEDREHPDKKVCISNLPAQNQVTFKLTVDSTFKQDTAIQVDALSNEVLFLRTDKPSCTDINLFGGVPTDLGVIKPIQP